MSFTVGIDIGTTSSCCAAYRPGIGPVVVETFDGSNFMPSAVSFDRDDKILTGRPALRNMADRPEFTFLNIKKEIGAVGGDYYEYTAQQAAGQNNTVEWVGPDRAYTSEELLSHVVNAMLLAAEFKFGERPTGVVATVPVDFHDPERRAVKAAIEMAGIEGDKIHLLEEPIAAAISFGLNDPDFKRNVVYDFGGGTFDITTIRSKGGEHKPVETGGSRYVGGSQIDKLIADQCIEAFMEEKGHDLREMPYVMIPLLKAAEDAKISLSYNKETRIFLPNILSFPDDKLTDIEFDIDVEALEEIAGPIVDETLVNCRETLEAAGYIPAQIDNIIMIGGQTRMPLVQKRVESFFGKKVIFESPETAVAKGAAIFAAEKDGLIEPTLMQKILNATVGIKHANGNFVAILNKGSKLPTEKQVEIKNAHEGQEFLRVEVSQGENRAASVNTLIFSQDCATESGRAFVHVAADDQGAVSVEIKDKNK